MSEKNEKPRAVAPFPTSPRGSEVVEIIKAAGESGVARLKFGGLEVEFEGRKEKDEQVPSSLPHWPISFPQNEEEVRSVEIGSGSGEALGNVRSPVERNAHASLSDDSGDAYGVDSEEDSLAEYQEILEDPAAWQDRMMNPEKYEE